LAHSEDASGNKNTEEFLFLAGAQGSAPLPGVFSLPEVSFIADFLALV
jgi:hypothetical protein